MITIDRSSSIPIADQIADQVRFLIASGQLRQGQLLPSTRRLAERLGVSFHTVRKAFSRLAGQSVLKAESGRGYRVCATSPTPKSERIERGATIMNDALHKLIGLGLDENEIEFLLHEQLSLVSSSNAEYKILVAAPFREMAASIGRQVENIVRVKVIVAVLSELETRRDVDYVIVPYTAVAVALDKIPKADVLGVDTFLSPGALETVSRLLATQTLGVITRYPDAMRPLVKRLRDETSFVGQVLAATTSDGSDALRSLGGQVDAVVFTLSAQRAVTMNMPSDVRVEKIDTLINPTSLELLVKELPTG